MAPGEGFTVIVKALIPATYLDPSGDAGPGALGSNFETDGDGFVDGDLVDSLNDNGKGDDLEIDWENLSFTNVADVNSGQTDDSFGQGSKENSAEPSVSLGSIPKQKSDLTNFLWALDTEGTDNFLYLGWLRENDLGTANIDAELNQALVDPNLGNGITPPRTPGDILFTFDFASNGNVITLRNYEWDGSEWTLKNGDLSAFATGAVNNIPIDNPIIPDAPDVLKELTFGEAVFNLSGIFENSQCTSFSSAFIKSRSSDSFTSSLKDFIAPTAVDIDTCRVVNLDNTATVTGTPPSGPNVTDLDDALIKVSNVPPVPIQVNAEPAVALTLGEFKRLMISKASMGVTKPSPLVSRGLLTAGSAVT